MAQRKPFINRDNPALNFISTAGQAEPEPAEKPAQTAAKAPEGYKINPQYIEKKTRRLQLVLQPSLYEKVKARVERNGTSVNDYIHSILEETTREE